MRTESAKKKKKKSIIPQSECVLTKRVVDAVGLLLHLLVQSFHVLHQQGHHLTLQLRTSTSQV